MKTAYIIEHIGASKDAGYRAVYGAQSGGRYKGKIRKCLDGEFTGGGFFARSLDNMAQGFFAGFTAEEVLRRIDGTERRTVGADVTDSKGKVIQRGTVRVERFGGMAHVHIVNRTELEAERLQASLTFAEVNRRATVSKTRLSRASRALRTVARKQAKQSERRAKARVKAVRNRLNANRALFTR